MKKSPRSSPGSARKEPVTPPVVALKPTKKPIKAPPVKSMSVDPDLTSHTKEEVKTSTPKPGEKPPEPETPPESKPPTKNVSSSQRSVRSDSSDLSSLFPKGNSHLFDDDEISQWFVKADGDLKTTTEEKEEDIPQVEEKKETPPKKPPVKESKPVIPEWKKSLQERRTLKEKETASPVKETKERSVPEKKDLFGQKDRRALEPEPLTVLSKEPQPTSEGKESKQVLEKESEPDSEKKSEPEPEKKSEPVPEKKPELVPEKKPEPVPEKKPEPVPEKIPEPVPEKKPEPVPEKKAEPVPEKKLEPEPVPEKKQDASTEQVPAGNEKTKKDEKIPEWKRRLEERRAARAKEMEDIRSSAKPKNVADWKTRKTDSAPEKKPEVVVEKAPEPTPEKKPEPVQEKKPEPVHEKKPEPVQEKKPEPVPEKKPEPVPEKQKVEFTEEQVEEMKEDKSTSVKSDVEEVVEQKVVEMVEETPPSVDKTVGEVATKEETSTKPDVPASDKKGDEKIPEWKKRLEERRAARAKERENIRSSTETKKVPDWKTKKTEESKATKESGKKAPAVTSTDSVPEWKKQLEERRKQRELEKAQKQTAKSREHSRNVEDNIPAWKKKLAERKAERETPAKSEPSTTMSTTQTEQRKPLFDESLLKESEKLEQKPIIKEESKEEKTKATIDSLFDEDDDVLFKSTTSSPPIPIMEPAEKKGESPVTLDNGDTPSPDIVIPEGQQSNVVSDWVVVDDEAVKQANEDIAAAEKKERSIKNEEQVSDKKTSPLLLDRKSSPLLSDRKSSPLPVRRTPSPTMKGSPKQSHDGSGSPSWLGRATKMREANQSKYTRTKTYSPVSSTKEDEEMPGWRKRVLERKKEKELASSRNRSPITKPKEASSSTSKSSSNENVKSEKKTELAKTSSPITTRQSQKPTTEDDVSDWQQRLAERKKAREMERQKKLGSTTKKAEAETSEEKPSPKEPAQEESKKTSSPLDDHDNDLPSWKSKLASRKKQLEKRKDELGVPVSVTASERAQSEPPHADEKETSEPLATKQEFTSSDNLLSAPGSQKMTGSRISSVSSVDEVFSASENTQDTEKTSSKTSLSPTGGEEVRKSPSPHSSTEPISAEEEIPPQGCVRRTSVKFSSKESDDDLPQWKKNLLERKKSGRKELGSDSNTSIESKKVRCVMCTHTRLSLCMCVVQVSVHVYVKICTACFIYCLHHRKRVFRNFSRSFDANGPTVKVRVGTV